MFGWHDARLGDSGSDAARRRRLVLHRCITAVLISSLVLGQTPAVLWANGLADEDAATQAFDQELVTPRDGTPSLQDGPSAPVDEGADESPAAPSLESPAPSVGAADSDAAVPSAPAQPDARDERALDDDCYIMVQDEKDKDDSYSKLTGALDAGAVLWANAYDWDDWVVPAESGWTYQWMWSPTKTADTGAFAPIEGETKQSLLLTDELASKIAGGYIAVKVNAGDVELWGPARSYGSLSSFDLPGPVNAADAINLSRVELRRSGAKISGDIDAILAPGDAVEAVAITGGSPADTATNGSAVDADKVSFAWTLLESKDAATGQALGTAPSAVIPAGDAALGRYLDVKVTAGVNTVSYTMGPICRAGALRLANISIVASGDGTTVEGATLTAKPVLTAGKVPPAGSVSYQWWISRAAAGEFEPIEGATDATLHVDATMIGARLQVTATAGGYNEVRATAGPILPGASAAAAAAALDSARFVPAPVFGESENVRDLVERELARLGYPAATVSVIAATEGAGGATVSSAPGERNGAVRFYYEDPESVEEPVGMASVKVDFRIESGGSAATWTRFITVRWDMDRVQQRLEQLVADELRASSLVAYEGGSANNELDTIEARRDLVLDDWIASWADISWSSSNEDVLKSDGTLVRRQSADGEASLTATVRFNKGADGERVPVATKDFTVTVKSIDSDPTLEEVLDAALGRVQLKDFASKQPVDPSCVVADIQLPTRRDLGITGSGYALAFAVDPSGSQACHVNGARLVVARPAPGMPDAHDTLIVTVSKNGVARSASFDIAVKALGTEEIDAELALMARVKEAYTGALLGENASADAVTADLKSFISVHAADDGSLTWVRSAGGTVPAGIAAVSIDPSRPSEQWDRFKSSKPAIVESETLRLVKQPRYNTRVTITSCLSSERFGDYYTRYKDDPAIDPVVLEKYRALSRQEVSASFIVRGTSGLDDPDAPAAKTVTARIMGVSEHDAQGSFHAQTWVPLREVVVPGDEPATAWDVFARLLDEAGYSYSLDGGVPYSVTTPDGSRTLAMSDTAPWSYWSFLYNGEYASDYANNVVVADGDTIELVYVDGSGTALPENDIVIDAGAARPDWGSEWPSFTTSNKPTSSLTPVAAAQEKWVVQIGGARENLSDPILVGDYLYIASTDRLLMVDAATGTTVREAKLASSIDSTARMVYAEGVVIVPLHGGRLQALTVDTLTTTWLTEPLPAATTPSGSTVEQQSLGTLTVRDGYVYAGTSDGSYDGSGTGYLLSVNIATGAVRFTRPMAGGYYWAGAVPMGDYLVVGDDAGNVYAFDPVTGATVGTPLALGAQVRSTIVAEGGYLYAADYKGTLHKLAMDADGTLSEVARVTFGKYCTSTPSVVNGKIVLCGQSATQGPSKYMKYAAVFVIDAETMTVEHEVCKTTDGGALPTMYSQSSPLVSVQDGDAFVYFTVNWNPSGLYRYRVGDDAVDVLYTPADAHQEYCMSSVVAGADGSLYYINDSGALFALKGAPSWRVSFDAANGTSVASVYVKRGAVVTRPADPVRAGYDFDGWYIDPACTTAWDFDAPVRADMTLRAKWIEHQTQPQPPVPERPIEPGDVPAGNNGGTGAPGSPAPVVPAVRPQASGTVVPGRRPVGDQRKTAASASAAARPQDEAASESEAGAPASTGGRNAEGDASPSGMSLVMVAIGFAGLAGLVVTGAWLLIAAARKRK